MQSRPNILYYSLNGLGEDLGKSQVLEYLLLLSTEFNIDLITFEKQISEEEITSINRLIADRISWHRLNYSNKYGSISTLLSLLNGLQLGRRIIRKKKIDIVHCRSMLPALIGLRLKKDKGCRLLFDIRGFATEEKVDRGRISRGGLIYKVLMWLEHKLYRNSDHVVTLTYKAKEILLNQYSEIPEKNITVIPTCASKETFRTLPAPERNQIRQQLGYSKEDIVFIHTGNVGTWYDLDAEMKLIKELSEKFGHIKFLIVNKGQHEQILHTAKKYNHSEEIDQIKGCHSSLITELLAFAPISEVIHRDDMILL